MQRCYKWTSLHWFHVCTCPVSKIPGWALWEVPAFKDSPLLQGRWSGTYAKFVFATEKCPVYLWIALAVSYLWKGSFPRRLTFPLWKEFRSRGTKTSPHPQWSPQAPWLLTPGRQGWIASGAPRWAGSCTDRAGGSQALDHRPAKCSPRSGVEILVFWASSAWTRENPCKIDHRQMISIKSVKWWVFFYML